MVPGAAEAHGEAEEVSEASEVEVLAGAVLREVGKINPLALYSLIKFCYIFAPYFKGGV